MTEFYFWVVLVVLLFLAGLGVYFREWLYVVPRDRKRATGKKTTFLEYIGLFIVSSIVLIGLFLWQYHTQD